MIDWEIIRPGGFVWTALFSTDKFTSKFGGKNVFKNSIIRMYKIQSFLEHRKDAIRDKFIHISIVIFSYFAERKVNICVVTPPNPVL